MQRRTLVCFLLSLLALPACSKDPSTPDYWVQQLDAAKRSSERVRVVDTLRSSGKMNKSFLPMLEAELAKEKNPEEKGALARALGDLKDPSAVPALSDALDLSSSDGATSRMNSAIAQALGAIQDPRAVPALLKLLKSKDDYVRMDAIQALGTLKATEAVPPLMELALDDASSPQVNRRAVATIHRMIRRNPKLKCSSFPRKGASPEKPKSACWSCSMTHCRDPDCSVKRT